MSNPWRCCDCSVPNTGYPPVEIWATPDAVVTVVFRNTGYPPVEIWATPDAVVTVVFLILVTHL